MNRPVMLNKKKKIDPVSIVLYVLAAVIVILLIGNIWFNRTHFVVTVSGPSMETTLMSGDKLYASKTAKAQRGDVVVIDATEHPAFANPDGSERLLIKRLIAVGGDCVKCENGVLWLKKAGGEYEVLSEPYLTQTTIDFEEIQVGEGEIFFLGDNRIVSMDARFVYEGGFTERLLYENIVGVVPEWAVNSKDFITRWESFRKSLSELFSIG